MCTFLLFISFFTPKIRFYLILWVWYSIQASIASRSSENNEFNYLKKQAIREHIYKGTSLNPSLVVPSHPQHGSASRISSISIQSIQPIHPSINQSPSSPPVSLFQESIIFIWLFLHCFGPIKWSNYPDYVFAEAGEFGIFHIFYRSVRLRSVRHITTGRMDLFWAASFWPYLKK